MLERSPCSAPHLQVCCQRLLAGPSVVDGAMLTRLNRCLCALGNTSPRSPRLCSRTDLILELAWRRIWLGNKTNPVPKQPAATDVLANVSCDDHCIMSGETCVDGGAVVVQKSLKSVNKVVGDARASGGTFLAPPSCPCSCCPKSVSFTANCQTSFLLRKCTMLNPGVLSG